MKTGKRFFLLLLAVSLIFSGASGLTGCAKGVSGKKEIAVIVKSTNSDFFHAMKNGVTAAATEYNVSVTFEGPENEEDYETQNQLIKNAIARGVQAIVLSAIDEHKSVSTVEEAVRKGIKVITIDSGVASGAVSLFIGTDNRAAGRKAGEAVRTCCSGTGTIRIGLVNYMEATENGREREEGFREYVGTLPNVRITAAVTVENNTESATEGALRLIREHPEINVLVGFNEWMTLGVGYAIRQCRAGDIVTGIGFDTNLVSISMIESGEMDALIAQNPFAIGYLGVKNAADLVSGVNVGETPIHTDVTLITRDNLFDEDIQKVLFRF